MRDRNSVSSFGHLWVILNFIDKAPRSRAKRARRYENIDLTKDFELRTKKRETEKLKKLEELYEKHDQRAALELKDVVSLRKEVTPQGEIPISAEEKEKKELEERKATAYDQIMNEMK